MGENAVLSFTYNKEVPFTNNLVKGDIGPTKVVQKISYSFRTLIGAEIYVRIK